MSYTLASHSELHIVQFWTCVFFDPWCLDRGGEGLALNRLADLEKRPVRERGETGYFYTFMNRQIRPPMTSISTDLSDFHPSFYSYQVSND